MVDSLTRRNWLRLTIRGALAITAFGAVLFALFRKRLEAARAQEDAVREIERIGGVLGYAHEWDNDADRFSGLPTPGPKLIRQGKGARKGGKEKGGREKGTGKEKGTGVFLGLSEEIHDMNMHQVLCLALGGLLLCGGASHHEPRFAITVADPQGSIDGPIPVLDKELAFDLPMVAGTKFSFVPAAGFNVLENDRPGGTGAITPATLFFTWHAWGRVVKHYEVFDKHSILATAQGDADGQFKLYVLPQVLDGPRLKAFKAIREMWKKQGKPSVADPIRLEIHAVYAGKKVAVTMIGPPPKDRSVQQFAKEVAASLRWAQKGTIHNKADVRVTRNPAE